MDSGSILSLWAGLVRRRWRLTGCAWLFLGTLAAAADLDNSLRIRPSGEHPRYWQYQGKPVLLLGGSKDDSLFQIPDLEEHLDELRAAGANVIRNTMSDRQDFGFEVYPHLRREDGRYDLEQWNPEYWTRFANLLRETRERDIIVQIEVWDRFDFSQEHWKVHPYNPAQNISYSPARSGLATNYPAPAWRDRQPFFHSVPGMPLYRGELDVVRRYQERFVGKLLSISLDYGHVLYCMNNETSTPLEWGLHWMSFIRKKAQERGLEVFVTDMFDDAWKPQSSAKLRHAVTHPGQYPFLDISQVNSRTFNEDHWNNVYWCARQVADAPRPMNHTKIYSDGKLGFGTGTPVDGVERFWRNLLAGSASCRFHRPGAGIGLNEIARACLAAARKAESVIPFWEVEPHMEMLGEREPDEAYLAANPGRQYLLFFTDGGSVTIDLKEQAGSYLVRWISIGSGQWGKTGSLAGGGTVPIQAPAKGPWVTAICRAEAK